MIELLSTVKEKYMYSENSKSFLIRLSDGKEAGGLTNTGYYRSRVTPKKKLFNHVIIWMLFYGIPDGYIDHIDGNRANNKITNLRCVSAANNSQNRCMQTNNTSGITSVFYEEDGIRSPRYRGIVSFNGKRVSKSFSLSKYGDKAMQMAENWVADMKHKFNQLGAVYSERQNFKGVGNANSIH